MEKQQNADRPPYYAWQSDPSNITTPKVQLWSKSGMMRGVISSELAVNLVNQKTHFVMCCQAIGEI